MKGVQASSSAGDQSARTLADEADAIIELRVIAVPLLRLPVCPWRKEGIVVSYETEHFAEGFGKYQQALRHGATLEIIMTALEAAKSSIAWTKDGGQYIPGISKWLQREPWREANLQKAQKENQEQWNSQ